MEHVDQPLVSIVIPTNGTSLTLRECLESCVKAARHYPLEVLVIFDPRHPKALSEQLKKDFPAFRLIVCEQTGVSCARNLGLQSLSGKHFLLIDDDCILGEKTWLEQVVSRCADGSLLHGGGYKIPAKSSYWAQVYNWINQCWLELGKNPDGNQSHLLGGFLFGAKKLVPHIVFNPSMQWGGEEKELLNRLREEHDVRGLLHEDLFIEHRDNSNFKNMIRRAYRQGLAAGGADLIDSYYRARPELPFKLLPGVSMFYIFSRLGVLRGKFLRMKNGDVKTPNTSPIA